MRPVSPIFAPWIALAADPAVATRLLAGAWINETTGCWERPGYHSKKGYAYLRNGDGKNAGAHRVAHEQWIGPIPGDEEIDHAACSHPGCCCPYHVEATSHRENLLRGRTITAAHANATHCPRGHAYTVENTYRRPSGRDRQCRACLNASRQAARLKAREQRRAGDPGIEGA